MVKQDVENGTGRREKVGPSFALIHGEATVLLFSVLEPFVSE